MNNASLGGAPSRVDALSRMTAPFQDGGTLHAKDWTQHIVMLCYTPNTIIPGWQIGRQNDGMNKNAFQVCVDLAQRNDNPLSFHI